MTFEQDIEPIIIKSFHDTSYMYHAMLNDILNVVNKYYIPIEKIDEKIKKITPERPWIGSESHFNWIEGRIKVLEELKQEINEK